MEVFTKKTRDGAAVSQQDSVDPLWHSGPHSKVVPGSTNERYICLGVCTQFGPLFVQTPQNIVTNSHPTRFHILMSDIFLVFSKFMNFMQIVFTKL